MEKEFASQVWAMSGFFVSYTPGILALQNGHLSFETATGEQFSIPQSEIKNVKWPKLQMGYGVNFDVNGKTYKFTFMRPTGQPEYGIGMIGKIANGVSAIKTLSHIKEYKAVSKEWREIVGG